MQTLPEVLLSFKFVWKAKSKKKSSLRWASKYFHKKMHRKRETFVGFFRESCQKLSGYEIDHESFEEIFLEQLLSGVLVILGPLTMGVGTSEPQNRRRIGVPLLDDSIC